VVESGCREKASDCLLDNTNSYKFHRKIGSISRIKPLKCNYSIKGGAAKQGEFNLCWSFVLDYENGANPFEEVRNRIHEWRGIATDDCDLNDEITKKAEELMKLGLRQMDASHVACAIYLKAGYFLTTDKKILNKQVSGIAIMNPIDFVRSELYEN